MVILVDKYPKIFDNILSSWIPFFNKPKVVEELDRVLSIVLEDKKYMCPRQQYIMEVFRQTHLHDIKVVILGKYPPCDNMDDGDGLALSNCSKALDNIYKCLVVSGLIQTHNTYSLKQWAKQGIFLLNSSLTCYKGSPEYHTEYWGNFINMVIVEINGLYDDEKISVMLWGDMKLYANKFKKCCVYTWTDPHPIYDNNVKSSKAKFRNMPYFKEISKKYPEIHWGPDLVHNNDLTSKKIDSAMGKNVRRTNIIELDVFTDGSFTGKSKKRSARGGWAYYMPEWGLKATGNLSSKEKISNQVAELMAIIKALKFIKKYIKCNIGNYNIKIISDSMYCYWIIYHSLMGWKTKSISKYPNNELVRMVDELVGAIVMVGTIEFIHVKAHKHNMDKSSVYYYYWEGNDVVDKLAKYGADLPLKNDGGSVTVSNARKLSNLFTTN